jgi:septin family protein
MARMKLLHAVRFLIWTALTKADDYTKSELAELKQSIDDRVVQMHEIDRVFLSHNRFPKFKKSKPQQRVGNPFKKPPILRISKQLARQKPSFR